MTGKVLVLKVDGNKVNTEYIVDMERYDPAKEKDVRKTIEDKIKNLALLMEKIPIDSVKFLEMLRQQLEAELGKYGIILKDVKLNFLEEIKAEEANKEAKDSAKTAKASKDTQKK